MNNSWISTRWVKIGPWSPDQARVEFLNRH